MNEQVLSLLIKQLQLRVNAIALNDKWSSWNASRLALEAQQYVASVRQVS
jgi:hypothetical protein